jgi:hypothetical protein
MGDTRVLERMTRPAADAVAVIVVYGMAAADCSPCPSLSRRPYTESDRSGLGVGTALDLRTSLMLHKESRSGKRPLIRPVSRT